MLVTLETKKRQERTYVHGTELGKEMVEEAALGFSDLAVDDGLGD